LRSDRVLLLDMQEAIGRVLRYTEGFDEASFLREEQTIDSVVRNIQIIGEAAFRINRTFRDAHAEIEWPGIIGMRHRLVHDYFEVEERIIWRVVETKLPPLLEQLKKILEDGVE